MTHQDVNLRGAFPPMPEECRSALSHAARSVKEEEPMKRKFPAALLAAAIFTLITTLAIAEGWNVLTFLGLQPDSDAQALVQPVSASASVDNCTIRIDSAITDGEYLAFDWAVANTCPEVPVYLRIECFTANGQPLHTDGTDGFNDQWLPGWCNDGAMMDGELIKLPDGLTDAALHVEMTVAVYTPDRPIFQIDEFDPEIVQAKQAEGYYVIVGGDGMVFCEPEERLFHGFPGPVLDHAAQGLVRSEMKVCFDLDLHAARATIRMPELAAPVIGEGTALALHSVSISPLQTHIVATLTPDHASYEDIVAWANDFSFHFCDAASKPLNPFAMCQMYLYETTVEEAADGTWFIQMDCALIGVEPAQPDEVILACQKEDASFRLEIPVTIQ